VSWYKSKGPQNDVVISTRARLARNISGYNFPSMLTPTDAVKIIDEVWQALSPISKDFTSYRTDSLSPEMQRSLIEKHLISPSLIENNFPRAVFINKDETISIMVNEEDHLRIQCLLPGFQPEKAWDTANKIDDLLNERLDFAFHEKYGYLTSCPTNTGTGLRISAMLHLPALSISGGINSLLSQAAKSGMAVRGLYGEGSEAQGNFFQISNQITLGLSEEELINKLTKVVNNVSEAEKSLRTQFKEQTPPKLIDKIMRSYALMKYSYILTSKELMIFLSDVRLGNYLGIINIKDIEKLTELMVTTMPANMILNAKTTVPEERDIKRAEIVRAALQQ